MGPHVFACGNRIPEVARRCTLDALQWGRTFLRAEMSRGRNSTLGTPPASMGPHVFACGNISWRAWRCRSALLQWGRTFLRAEILLLGFLGISRPGASMGPHVFACGNRRNAGRGCCTRRRLQWGRTFLRAEIPSLTRAPLGARPSFNGAARFCVRKWGRVPLGRGRRARASMGPHVFACGNRESMRTEATMTQLQWGRTFLRAEIRRHVRWRLGQQRLQWGRTFLRAEIWHFHPHPAEPPGFNGAARFCVRKFGASRRRPRRRTASMGPHVFACGNREYEMKERQKRELQWGRTFLRAEIDLHEPLGLTDFQLQWGRTFLRAEILDDRRRPCGPYSFNGAARFCVRKYGVAQSQADRAGASMGPHVFACGNPDAFRLGDVASLLQWGRTFLRAEILSKTPRCWPVFRLQWGRTFLRAEISHASTS